MTEDELARDARRLARDLFQNGDPFNGDDWTLMQILNAFIRKVEGERAKPAADDCDPPVMANELGESGA